MILLPFTPKHIQGKIRGLQYFIYLFTLNYIFTYFEFLDQNHCMPIRFFCGLIMKSIHGLLIY